MRVHLVQDLRFALRSFLRSPRFTIPALMALALGIGATSAVFSLVRGVMLKPLPYDDPARIVTVWETNVGRNRLRNVVSAANFLAWTERQRSFAFLGMVGPTRLNVTIDGQPQELAGLSVSGDAFAALGTPARIGRVYTADADLRGSDLVIVISHELWQTRLGGRDVVGSTLVTSGRPRTIVGVMPPGFTIEGQRADFMVPYGWTTEQLRTAPGRGSSHGVARLRDGVTVAQAESEMRAIAAQLASEAPQRNSGWSVAVVPIHELMVETIRPALLVLSGAVLLVLLVACVNVANLLLARSIARQRELGLRTALGARRGRLLRQMLTESLLLSFIGGGAGLLLAVAFHRGLLALVANQIPVPRLDQVALDLPVLAFTLAVVIATGLLFGLVPALASARDANDALREGGRHGSSPRARRALGALVVSEIALSLVLLTGAGLLIRSFVRLQNVDPGFTSEGVMTARVALPATAYPQPAAISGFFTEALTRIESLPGVEDAAGVTFLPLAGPGIGTGFWRLDQPPPAAGAAPTTEVRPVTPGFFATMKIPQLAGRDLSAADVAGAPLVAVISQSLARQHFAGEDPLGRRLLVRVGGGGGEGMNVEIVGVVGDVKFTSLDTDTQAAIYLPHPQLALNQMTFVVRSAVESGALIRSLAGAVHSLDRELPIADVRSLDDVVDATLARPRTISVLLAAFAVFALVLAGVGVYGVMAYSVSQRTQEIGVRMALGATRESVFRLVMGGALTLVGLGVGAGLLIAVGATKVLETLLFETTSLDPVVFGGTALLLAAVALLASYVPARRGTLVAPVEALRAE